MSLTGMFSGKAQGDEVIAHNQKGSAYEWYSSKGIKQTLVEGQKDFLKAITEAGIVTKDKQEVVEKIIKKNEEKIKRYDKEKLEILMGSVKVGKDNWMQEVDGKLGKVIGAKEWEEKADALRVVGDTYDMGTLFLQIAMVIGAIGLVMHQLRLKWITFYIMIFLGVIGSYYSINGFIKALAIG